MVVVARIPDRCRDPRDRGHWKRGGPQHACTGSQRVGGSTPAGTPYPTPVAQPPAPAEGVTEYPDPTSYGKVADDCSTFNGLPYGGNLKDIKATDDHTVVFTFCNPDVAFLSQIAFQALAIDDAGYLIANAGTTPGSGNILNQPNGTGPYMLANWDKGNRMDLVANPNYWGTAPLTPKLELQWSDTSAARLTALQAGTIDGMDNPGTGDIAAIQGDSSLKFYPRTGLNTFYLGMNNTYKPWDNLKVRQAIAMGIDRQKIVDNYYPPGSSVADFFTPNAIPYANQGDAWYTFDAAAAKTLLDQGLQEEGIDPATWQPKLSFRSAVRGYLPDPPTIAQEIATQLQTNLGINVHTGSAGVRHLPGQQQRRQAGRPVHARLGRRLPGCQQLPRLPLRVRPALRHPDPRPGQGDPDRRPVGRSGLPARPRTPRPTT